MRQLSRRSVLAMTGASLGGFIAGCLGDDSGPSPKGETVDHLPVPVIGSEDAAMVLSVFEDFSCPSCRQFKATITPVLVDEYVETGVIQYAHRDFPFLDDWSWQVASGARAVQDHGDDEDFFEFAEGIYGFQGSYSLDAIEQVADEVGPLGSVARDAADALTYQPVLETDRDYGNELGVPGTPAVAIDGELLDFSGASTINDWLDTIETEISARQ